MIDKEELQKAKEKATNIAKAQLSQGEKSIQETQKFYETLETCNDILNEIKQEQEQNTNFYNQLDSAMEKCGEKYENMRVSIENTTKNFQNLLQTFDNRLQTTSQEIQKAIHHDITLIMQEEMSKIEQNTTNFSNTLNKINTEMNEKINNYSKELDTKVNNFQKTMEKESLLLITGNKFLFFLFIFLSLIPSLYCLNYQFNFIPILSQPITSEYIKGLITTPIALIILIVIIAIFKGIFKPKQKSYY